MMKVALVHDYLNQLGGGERVLDELIRIFPEADVYTLLYDEQKTRGRYAGKVKGTSFLDFKFARDHHRLFIPLMPLAASKIDLGGRYDLIISDTAGFAKGISYDRETTKHISYIHTPLRYAWETENYFDNSPENVALKILAAPLFAYVRHNDYQTGQRPDFLFANSHYIANKVKQYYGRDAEVLYPPVDSAKFYPNGIEGGYYLAAGRLLHYKRFDLIIDAFNKLGLPLKIVGSGPEEAMLWSRIKSDKIEMIGFVKDDGELRSLYQNAKAFIMANDEDFGLVMAEAQSCGTPVIAYGAGGALEIVKDGSAGSPQEKKTGVLFGEQTAASIIDAVGRFEHIDFDRKNISESAKRFSTEQFRQGIEAAVRNVIQKKKSP